MSSSDVAATLSIQSASRNNARNNMSSSSRDYVSEDDTWDSPRLPKYSHYEAAKEKDDAYEPEVTETARPQFSPISGGFLTPSPPDAVLVRGLQIPTRISYISSGFRLPPTLVETGVDRARWKAFTREVKSHGQLSKTQWASLIACSSGVSIAVDLVLPPFGHFVVAPIFGHKRRKQKESQNFHIAYSSGGLEKLAEKWNEILFGPLGLECRIEPPNYVGSRAMNTMDVASTKYFKYYEKRGWYSSKAATISDYGDKKEVKYSGKEGRQRTKAARKGRIIVMPINWNPIPVPKMPEEPPAIPSRDKKPAASESGTAIGQLDGGSAMDTRRGRGDDHGGAVAFGMPPVALPEPPALPVAPPATRPSTTSQASTTCTLAMQAANLGHAANAAACGIQ